MQPYVEACWYFTGTREQYRLAGKVQVVDRDSTDEVLLKVPPFLLRLRGMMGASAMPQMSGLRLYFRGPLREANRGGECGQSAAVARRQSACFDM